MPGKVEVEIEVEGWGRRDKGVEEGVNEVDEVEGKKKGAPEPEGRWQGWQRWVGSDWEDKSAGRKGVEEWG